MKLNDDKEDLVLQNIHKLNEDNHKQIIYQYFKKTVQLQTISFVSASLSKLINKALALLKLAKD